MVKIKYYKTGLEGQNEDRFQMLADLLSADAKEMAPATPRILHLDDVRNYQSGYAA